MATLSLRPHCVLPHCPLAATREGETVLFLLLCGHQSQGPSLVTSFNHNDPLKASSSGIVTLGSGVQPASAGHSCALPGVSPLPWAQREPRREGSPLPQQRQKLWSQLRPQPEEAFEAILPLFHTLLVRFLDHPPCKVAVDTVNSGSMPCAIRPK